MDCKKIILASVMLFVFLKPQISTADIFFTCSWNGDEPNLLTVSEKSQTASLGQKKNMYKVLKITEYAVWLMIDEPTTSSGISIHMVQRAFSTNNKSGKWIDIVSNYKGDVVPIDAGICWEKQT